MSIGKTNVEKSEVRNKEILRINRDVFYILKTVLVQHPICQNYGYLLAYKVYNPNQTMLLIGIL